MNGGRFMHKNNNKTHKERKYTRRTISLFKIKDAKYKL